MKALFPLALVLLASATAFAGDPPDSKKTVVPPEEDHWKFLLAMPGWMAGIEGTVGVGGVNSDIDVGFKDLVNKIDMIFAMRVEASKGRFGIMGELIYLSMSDSLGIGGPVRKVDVQVDEYLADLTLRWRLVEGKRGFVDALVGVRYTNLYQSIHLQPDDQAIGNTSKEFVDDISARIRERIDEVLSEARFRNALKEALKARITDKLAGVTGPKPRNRSLPTGPLTDRPVTKVGLDIERLVRRKEAELVRTTLDTARAAVAAEKEAIQAATAALRAAAQVRATALRATVNARIATAKAELEDKIQDKLHDALSQSVALDYAWWDPYVGLRARYNFTPAIYVIGRGDIGGFGVGSKLMWQAEGALGIQLTRSIYAELGYRALSFDYENDGFVYDVITHGAQVTVGIEF